MAIDAMIAIIDNTSNIKNNSSTRNNRISSFSNHNHSVNSKKSINFPAQYKVHFTGLSWGQVVYHTPH